MQVLIGVYRFVETAVLCALVETNCRCNGLNEFSSALFMWLLIAAFGSRPTAGLPCGKDDRFQKSVGIGMSSQRFVRGNAKRRLFRPYGRFVGPEVVAAMLTNPDVDPHPQPLEKPQTAVDMIAEKFGRFATIHNSTPFLRRTGFKRSKRPKTWMQRHAPGYRNPVSRFWSVPDPHQAAPRDQILRPETSNRPSASNR